jgi:hypothetical protein
MRSMTAIGLIYDTETQTCHWPEPTKTPDECTHEHWLEWSAPIVERKCLECGEMLPTNQPASDLNSEGP